MRLHLIFSIEFNRSVDLTMFYLSESIHSQEYCVVFNARLRQGNRGDSAGSCLSQNSESRGVIKHCFVTQAAEHDDEGKHTSEIQQQLFKCNQALSSQREGESEEETLQRAMRDPEVAVS